MKISMIIKEKMGKKIKDRNNRIMRSNEQRNNRK